MATGTAIPIVERAPWTKRLNTSLPNWSVPNRFGTPGVRSETSKSTLLGSWVANCGAKMALAMNTARMPPPK